MIYHKGRWLIAPEIKALLDKLEDMNEELRSEADRVLRENTVLREKQESADRQIAEYKRLLKAAVDDVRYCMRSYDPCEVCALLEENGECVAADDDDCSEKYKWRYEAEALALIGGRTVMQMADELIRLDTTIIGIDSLINKASTAEEAKVLFTVKDVIYSQQRYVTDVQPVVRCKDCKHRKERHYEESGEKPYIKYECKFTKYSMSDEGFCSFGAKMGGDTE